jgi:hypothetical protein
MCVVKNQHVEEGEKEGRSRLVKRLRPLEVCLPVLEQCVYKRSQRRSFCENDQNAQQQQKDHYRAQPPLLAYTHECPKLAKNADSAFHIPENAHYIQLLRGIQFYNKSAKMSSFELSDTYFGATGLNPLYTDIRQRTGQLHAEERG